MENEETQLSENNEENSETTNNNLEILPDGSVNFRNQESSSTEVQDDIEPRDSMTVEDDLETPVGVSPAQDSSLTSELINVQDELEPHDNMNPKSEQSSETDLTSKIKDGLETPRDSPTCETDLETKSQPGSEKYNADQSSRLTTESQESDENKKKKLRKRSKQEIPGSPSSARSASPAALRLPPPRIQTSPKISVPMFTTASQTNPDIERLLLPALRNQGQEGDLRVLGTGLTTTLQGDHPPALMLPLDVFGLLSDEEVPLPKTTSSARRRCRGLNLHTTYQASRSDGGSARTVDTHLTYRVLQPRAAEWRVDIDGAGLQLIVDLADENAKKKKKKKPTLRVFKRTPISFRPKKYKLEFSKSRRYKLQWVEDEAEEKHVNRMIKSRSNCQQRMIPIITYRPNLRQNERSNVETEHLARMKRAREIKTSVVPEPRSFSSKILSPSSLPIDASPRLYEDQRTMRIREARNFYNQRNIPRNKSNTNNAI